MTETLFEEGIVREHEWYRNVNPYSIRRLYAQNLVKRGSDINFVSHALALSDLSTTSRYLGLDANTVAKNLRDFL